MEIARDAIETRITPYIRAVLRKLRLTMRSETGGEDGNPSHSFSVAGPDLSWYASRTRTGDPGRSQRHILRPDRCADLEPAAANQDMQDLVNASDPRTRQRLMQQNWQSMLDYMQ